MNKTATADTSAAASQEASYVKAWPALLVVVSVVVGALIAFAHRPLPPFPPTQIFPDRLLVTSVVRVGKNLVAAGEQGRILVATDAQGPWQEAKVEPQRGSTFTQLVAIGEQVAIAVGHDGWVVRSADGGQTWKEVAFNLPAPAGAAAEAIPDPFADSASESEPAPEGGESAEGAEPMGEAPIPPASSDPLLGVAGPYDGKLYAFGAFGLFLSSSDQGQTWTREAHAAIGDRHLNAMRRADDGGLVLVGERGLMAKSVDGGASWSLLPEIYAGSYYGLVAIPGQALVAFGMRGNVFRSTDSGQTWTRSKVPLQQSLFAGVVGPEGEVILGGASNTVLVSRDNGASFTLSAAKARNAIAGLLPLGKGQWLTVGDGGIRVEHEASGIVPEEPEPAAEAGE